MSTTAAFPGPLPAAEWPAPARGLAAVLPVERGADRPSDLFATVARHPELLARLWALVELLLGGGVLGPRERELILLRVATLQDCRYEWDRHVDAALAAGIEEAQLESLRRGGPLVGWSGTDRALVQAVDQVLARGTIRPGTARRLAAALDARQLIELPLLTCVFAGICTLANAAGLRGEPSHSRRGT